MGTIHVTRAEEGEHPLVGTDVTTIRASGRETSGNLLVLEGAGEWRRPIEQAGLLGCFAETIVRGRGRRRR